ncbi:hypothetical protein IKF63_01555 [Candidatus Saccharibacteria bacterium]|nr:hypothetical protein [Candidatus Saccharibacteria bacterium]
MMSGYYDWNGNADWGVKNSYGGFWSSTPYAYTNSHYLFFGSANVNPKNGGKPGGFTLRCVAQQFTKTVEEAFIPLSEALKKIHGIFD